TTWINRGRIRGGKLNGTLALIEEDARRVAELVTDAQSTRQQLRAEVAHLEGQPITVGMAARKYGLTTPSISRWAKAGYIRVIHRSGHGRPTLIDESDVAYAQKLMKLHQA